MPTSHPNTLTSFPADHPLQVKLDRFAQYQEAVNATYVQFGAQEAADLARRIAVEEHIEYPQYDGKWDGWTLGRITMDCKSKGGTQAVKGDFVIMTHERGMGLSQGYTTFYSVRLGWNCSAGYGVEPIEGWSRYFASTREAGR
jgi:hypothetical protein